MTFQSALEPSTGRSEAALSVGMESRVESQLVLINTGTLELVEVTTAKPGVRDPRPRCRPETGSGPRRAQKQAVDP